MNLGAWENGCRCLHQALDSIINGDWVAAVGGGSVTQLAIRIGTHRPESAVLLQIHRMITSRGNPHHPARRIARSVHHLYRVASIRGSPVPQLAIIISTHGPDRTVPFKIHRMKTSDRDTHHPAQRIARSIDHLHRIASIRGGPVPQLAIIISPCPRPYRPPSNTPFDVVPRNSHHPAQRIARSIHHLHRIGSIRGGTVSQSTISIMTHRPDRAVPLQIHCVINTRGDPHPPAQRVADSSKTCTGLVLFVVVPSPSPSWPK